MTTTNAQLFSNTIAPSSTIVFEPLLAKYKTLQYIHSAISLLVLLIIISLAYYFIEEMSWEILLLSISISTLWLIFIIANIHFGFKHKGLAIREKDIHYQTGWINREITSVAICRIQHMKVTQGVFSKILGLAKLKIYTAGESSDDLTIKGVSFDKAQNIKTFLSEKIRANAHN